MRYNIVVCDDNKAIRDKIVKALRSLEQELNENFEIEQFASAEELLFEYSESTDILILDIQMLQMTGMQAARELRKRDRNVQIIFLTALSEYAVEGYNVHAYSFLVKPVSESVLKDKVRSVIDLMSVDKPVYIEFKSKDGIDVVNIGTVLYIESFSHDVVVHTAEGAKKYPKRMRDIEDRLYEHDFFRIHKSYVINLKKVTRISGENVILEDGSVLPVSRNRRKEFLIRFTEFMQ